MKTLTDDAITIATLREEHFEKTARRFKLLGDSSRLQILSAICQEEHNVTDICTLTCLNQANVSKHLQLLKLSGVVASRQAGRCRYYRIIAKEILSLCAQLLLKP